MFLLRFFCGVKSEREEKKTFGTVRCLHHTCVELKINCEVIYAIYVRPLRKNENQKTATTGLF